MSNGNNIRFDFFFRAETNTTNLKGRTYQQYWSEREAKCLMLDLDAETTLEEALDTARAHGMPKGSHRSACFQIQTDLGIYDSTHEFGVRINPHRPETFTFKTWAELEAEELAA